MTHSLSLQRRSLVAVLATATVLLAGLLPLPAVAAEELLPVPIDAGSRLVEFDLPNTSSLPTDIVAGADGTVWVSLLGERNVLHLDRDGVVLATIPVTGPVTKMSTDREGGVWGVELTSNIIVHISADHRADEHALPSLNSFPSDVWDVGELVFFVESNRGVVGRLTEATGVIDEWAVPGAVDLESVVGDSTTRGDYIGVSDPGAGVVWVLDLAGRVNSTCGSRVEDLYSASLVGTPWSFLIKSPSGLGPIFCGEDGTSGPVQPEIAGSGFSAADQFIAPNITWWVDSGSGVIGSLAPASQGRRDYRLPSGRGASGIAFTEGRYVWTVEKSAGKVVRLDRLVRADVKRLEGADRYETAVEISRGVTAPKTVFIVSGEKFADAVSAAPAAGINDAPLLLTKRDALPEVVRARLAEIDPDRVIVVGGPASVSEQVITAIGMASPAAQVRRIDGADRYAVSRALLASGLSGNSDSVYIANGRDFPDALSSGPAAAISGTGILLVDGPAASLSSDELAVASRYRRVTIVGGPASVSPGIEEQVGVVSAVARIGGSDRYAVSRAINEKIYEIETASTLRIAEVHFASGSSFPDALADGAAIGALPVPLYLVPPNCVPAGPIRAVLKGDVPLITLVGGPNSLEEGVASLTPCP